MNKNQLNFECLFTSQYRVIRIRLRYLYQPEYNKIDILFQRKTRSFTLIFVVWFILLENSTSSERNPLCDSVHNIFWYSTDSYHLLVLSFKHIYISKCTGFLVVCLVFVFCLSCVLSMHHLDLTKTDFSFIYLIADNRFFFTGPCVFVIMVYIILNFVLQNIAIGLQALFRLF